MTTTPPKTRREILAEIALIEGMGLLCLPKAECTCPWCERYCDLWGMLDALPEPKRHRKVKTKTPNLTYTRSDGKTDEVVALVNRLRRKHQMGLSWLSDERADVLEALTQLSNGKS